MDRAWLGGIAVLVVTGCGGVSSIVSSNSDQSPERDMAADADISRLLRRMILSDELMSPEARNLYINTRNGIVTLSGAVGSEAERAKVRQFAELVTAKNAIQDEMRIIPESVAKRLTKEVRRDGKESSPRRPR